MSRELFAFLLSELQTVRVICQGAGCGKIVEMSLAAMASASATRRCPFCNQDFDTQHTGTSALAGFAQAAKALQGMEHLVQVEFVLPKPAPPKP